MRVWHGIWGLIIIGGIRGPLRVRWTLFSGKQTWGFQHLGPFGLLVPGEKEWDWAKKLSIRVANIRIVDETKLLIKHDAHTFLAATNVGVELPIIVMIKSCFDDMHTHFKQQQAWHQMLGWKSQSLWWSKVAMMTCMFMTNKKQEEPGDLQPHYFIKLGYLKIS